MGVPLFKFRLTHQFPEGAVEFTNNEFQVSITGWDQFVFSGTQSFNWDAGTARADGSVSNLPSTAAIGQIGPSITGSRWHPGTYTIDIVAKNNSAGGSAPFQSLLNVYASNSIASIQQSVTYTGVGTWDVVPISDGHTTRRITFVLDDYWNYIFFSFSKVGPTSGYEVDFKIDSINIVTIPSTQLISEPDGWKNAVLKLERHEDFHSLVEYFEGSFIFYGSNGVKDGGINFIKHYEYLYGSDVRINIDIDVSFNDGGSYDSVFSGQLDLSGCQELSNNKMEIPIIRNDFWAKFISRKDTPVNLRASTDLDGGTVPIIELVDIQLTGQLIRYNGYYRWKQSVTYEEGDNLGFQFDWDDSITDDFRKFNLPRVKVPTVIIDGFVQADIGGIIEAPWDGNYTFECRIEAAEYTGAVWNGNIVLNIWIQKYGEHPSTRIQFTEALQTFGGDSIRVFTVTQNYVLKKGEQVMIYGVSNDNGIDDTVFGWNLSDTDGNDLQFRAYPGSGEPNTYLRVTADTSFTDSNTQAYLIHDAGNAITDRIIGRPNTFYSEYIGSTVTNGRSYDSDGCGWPFAIMPGLQLRGYSFDQKQFSMSFMNWWKGANPELNLGLGYTNVNDVEVIEVDSKGAFYDNSSVSVYISNAYLTREYDNDKIFNKINVGNSKWQSEDISGLDDPQTKHVYAIPFIKVGKEITIHSEFIAASNAIEVTRRQSIDQTKDFKFDNDVFIIALNTDDVSPDRYRPELIENFNSVSGIFNSSTRYNFILTPLRKLLRWANYLGGCLQKNTSNLPYKFVSGEGNYDLITDYACAGNSQCIAVICDSLSEKQDINLSTSNYNTTIGYLHLPDLFTTEVDMTWEEYQAIRSDRKKAIGVSQTSSNHQRFFIKSLDYMICKAKAKIQMWAYDNSQLNVIESIQPTPAICVPVVSSDADQDGLSDCYEAVLAYGETI